MRKNPYIIGTLQFLFIIFCLGFWGMTAHADEMKRVLFISSYSYAWDMVPSQMEGIRAGLGEDVELDYEFMDTKRVDDAESLKLFHDGLKYRLEHVEPYDVIILGDDAALVFALEYQDELFAGIPMVFQSVNDEDLVARAMQNPYVAGVIERLSVSKTIELGQKINPNATKVVAILDNTLTGEAERSRFFSYEDQFPELEFSEINTSELTTSKLRQAVRNVDEDSILIYVVMTEDASGKRYSNREVVRLLTSVAKVPVYRMVEGYGIGEGLIGGNVVSMYTSGEMAAQIAMDIMAGVDPSDLTEVLDSPNKYYVDAQIMEKFDVNLSVLPEDTVILNYEGSFLEQYKAVLIPAAVLLGTLTIVIIVVGIDNIRRRKLLTQLENARKTIETASQHDFLTGISNRSKFMSDLTELVQAGVPCTVIMVDIDNFKHINDNMGHKAGDEALQQLGQRLREMESQILTPYRYAGDEFILILRSSQKKIVEKTAYQCRQLFTKPFILNKNKTKIGGSIGISSYPEDTKDMEELIIFADAAMYEVKKNGKNDFAFYNKNIQRT